jgi:hypothetical protein
MKSLRTLTLLSLLSLGLFSACGNDNQNGPVVYGAGVVGNGVCGPQISQDYNQVVAACQNQNQGQIGVVGGCGQQRYGNGGCGRVQNQCWAAASNFLQRYPQVNCEAGAMGTNQPFRISEQLVRQISGINLRVGPNGPMGPGVPYPQPY